MKEIMEKEERFIIKNEEKTHLSLSVLGMSEDEILRSFVGLGASADYDNILNPEFDYLNYFNGNIDKNHSLKHLNNWAEEGFLCGYVGFPENHNDVSISHGDSVSKYLEPKDEKYEGYEILCFYIGPGISSIPQVIIYNPVEYQKIPDEHKQSYILDLISKQIEKEFDIDVIDDVVIDENDGFDKLLPELDEEGYIIPDENGYIINWESEKDGLVEAHLKVYVTEDYEGNLAWCVDGELNYRDDRWDDSTMAYPDPISTEEGALYEARRFYSTIPDELKSLHKEESHKEESTMGNNVVDNTLIESLVEELKNINANLALIHQAINQLNTKKQ